MPELENPTRLRVAAFAAGAVAAALGAVAVRYVGTGWDRVNAWEGSVGAAQRQPAFVHGPFGRGLDVLMLLLVPLGVAVLIVYLVRSADPALAAVSLIALGGSFLTSEILKDSLTARAGVVPYQAHGFPSGHTTLAVATALGYAVSTRGRRRLAVATGYATFVAAGVVLDGWHLPSDVAGACCIVLAWFLGVATLVNPRGGSLHPRAVALALAVPVVVTAVLLLHAGIPAHEAFGHATVAACAGAAAFATATVLAGAWAVSR